MSQTGRGVAMIALLAIIWLGRELSGSQIDHATLILGLVPLLLAIILSVAMTVVETARLNEAGIEMYTSIWHLGFWKVVRGLNGVFLICGALVALFVVLFA